MKIENGVSGEEGRYIKVFFILILELLTQLLTEIWDLYLGKKLAGMLAFSSVAFELAKKIVATMIHVKASHNSLII